MDSKTELYCNLKDCLRNDSVHSGVQNTVLYPKQEKLEKLIINKCYKCVKKKKFEILEKCECGIQYCIKHRFHDCPSKNKKLVLPEAATFKKIDKI